MKIKLCLIGNAESPHLKKWIENLSGNSNFDLTVISSHPTSFKNAIYDKNRMSQLARLATAFKPFSFLIRSYTVKKLLEEIKPDIVHIHQLSGFGVAAAFSGFHPMIISTWGTDVRENSFVMTFLKKKALNKADFITATSGALKKQTEGLLGDKKSIEVVPFGIDLKKFNPDKIKD